MPVRQRIALISLGSAITTRLRRPRQRHSSMTRRVHRIPLPTFVTIAKRPSYRVRDVRMIVLIWGSRQCRSGCGRLARRANRLFVVKPESSRRHQTLDLDRPLANLREVLRWKLAQMAPLLGSRGKSAPRHPRSAMQPDFNQSNAPAGMIGYR
jgi:hypothetical protein